MLSGGATWQQRIICTCRTGAYNQWLSLPNLQPLQKWSRDLNSARNHFYWLNRFFLQKLISHEAWSVNPTHIVLNESRNCTLCLLLNWREPSKKQQNQKQTKKKQTNQPKQKTNKSKKGGITLNANETSSSPLVSSFVLF